MAQYLDLTGAEYLVGKIRDEISTGDAKAIKKVYLDDATRTIKFFKDENALDTATGDFEVIIPDDVDTSNLLEKLVGDTDGNIIVANGDGTIKDSGTALTDLATKAELTGLSDKIGDLDTLTTTATDSLVNAINEVDAAIDTAKAESVVTVEEDGVNPDFAKVYTIKQNGQEIGKVNIPKDMVVQSGQIVTDPADQAPGKYLELTIANGNGDKVYIAVADLVAAYTVEAGAAQIQLALSPTHEFSATIVAESITATELANDAVTTDKILDANVTFAKLATDVTTAFDTVGSATNAETNAKAYADQKVAEISAIGTDEIDALF